MFSQIKKEYKLLFSILVIFLLLRIISWSQVETLEDHDSVNYLKTAEIIKSYQWEKLDSRDTFFYPITIGLLNALGIKLETAGRMISFLSSVILFFTIYFLGKKLTTLNNTFIALLLLTFSPFFISFSFAVLSEPSYISLTYLGILLFLNFIRRPKLTKVFTLGLIFGLSFSDRAEGIIFLFFIPLLVFLYHLGNKDQYYSKRKLLSWGGIFIVGFSIITVPIIYFVSSQMGTFSINGRTAWEELLKRDKRSYEETINSLDFDPAQTNLNYVLSHPTTLKNSDITGKFFQDIKFIFNNLKVLITEQLSSVLGIFILIFSGIGIYQFILYKKIQELLFVLSIIIIVLIPPMFLYSFIDRHIAIVAPILILVAGMGLGEISTKIENLISDKRLLKILKNKIPIIIVGFTLFFSVSWLNDALRHPSQNSEYNYKFLQKPIKILKNDIEVNNIAFPKMVARKAYFPFYAGINNITTPYTDYKHLIKYIKLNHANYLFLEYDHLRNYPFIRDFDGKKTTDFVLLYSSSENGKNKIALYRFIGN